MARLLGPGPMVLAAGAGDLDANGIDDLFLGIGSQTPMPGPAVLLFAP